MRFSEIMEIIGNVWMWVFGIWIVLGIVSGQFWEDIKDFIDWKNRDNR